MKCQCLCHFKLCGSSQALHVSETTENSSNSTLYSTSGSLLIASTLSEDGQLRKPPSRQSLFKKKTRVCVECPSPGICTKQRLRSSDQSAHSISITGVLGTFLFIILRFYGKCKVPCPLKGLSIQSHRKPSKQCLIGCMENLWLLS